MGWPGLVGLVRVSGGKWTGVAGEKGELSGEGEAGWLVS